MLRACMDVFELLLLGSATLSSGGITIPLPAKLKGLVAYAAMRGGADRAELAELLWGAGARHNLRVALHQLRRSLPGDDGAAAWGAHQRIAIAAECDALRFERAVQEERLTEAVALWRDAAAGRPHRDVFMAGFELPTAAGFQDWLEQERARLGGLYLRSLWRLAEAAEADGDSDAAVTWLRSLLDEDPLDERAHRRVMRIALARGDAATALEQFDVCRRVLRTELGVEPAAATAALAEEARAVAARTWSVDGAAVPRADAADGAAEDGLVGRDEELAEIAALLPTAAPLSIVGPGGVGKSRVARALGERWRHRGGDVVHVSVDGVGDAAGVLFAIAGALGVAGDSPERVIASVRARLARGSELLVVDGVEQRHRAAALLARLLDGVPAGRCVVTSREPIGVGGEVGYRLRGMTQPAGRRWRDAPAARLFVAAARRSDAAYALGPADRAPLAALVEAVEGLPLGLVLAASLAPAFSLDEIARIARERPEAIGGDAALAVPERHRSLERVLEASIEGMEPGRVERLVTCGAFADAFDRHAAEAVAGASVADLAGWSRAGWLQPVAGDRWSMHGRVRAFLARHASPETLRCARARHAGHFLRELRRGEATLRIATAEGGVERLGRALPELHAAWRAVDPDELAGAVEAMALLLDVRARHAEAIDLLAGSLARRPRDLSVRAALHTALASFENRVGRRSRALRRAQLGAAVALRAGDAPRAGRATWQAAEVLYDQGRYDEAEAALDRLGDGWSGGGHVGRTATQRLRALVVLGRSRAHGTPTATTPSYLAQVAAARAGFERCLALARRHDDVLAEAEALHDLGYCHYAVGDFAAALAAFRLAERRHRAAGAERRRTIEGYWIGVAATMVGDHVEADRSLRAALRAMDEAGETPKALEVIQAIGQLWWRRGEPLRAAACFLAAVTDPGLDARVRQGIDAWHLPQVRAVLDAGTWSMIAAHTLALGYRDAVAALVRDGSLPLPGEG
jgi:DNA-binding SARP family transcriptional activator